MKIRSIRSDDIDWLMDDGIKLVPRSALEITSECPEAYKQIIAECVHRGWLRTIAYQYKHEEFMEKLAK
jgi:hypothetical protein